MYEIIYTGLYLFTSNFMRVLFMTVIYAIHMIFYAGLYRLTSHIMPVLLLTEIYTIVYRECLV